MKQFALEDRHNQQDLFTATASKMKINADAVEKDFWVCYMIDHLFNDSAFKDKFVFKGGTSLSKSYHVIERFSEDIDMVLDWTSVSDENSNPWEDRSNTKQDKYNKDMNAKAARFYRETLVPALNEELNEKMGGRDWVGVDPDDEMVINHWPIIRTTKLCLLGMQGIYMMSTVWETAMLKNRPLLKRNC